MHIPHATQHLLQQLHIYTCMHGLRSTLPREEGPKWALKEVATDSPAAEDKEDGDSISSEEESSDCFSDNELLA